MIKLYKKYEEIILYLVVGGLTTVFNVLIYGLFTNILNVYYLISNIIAWIASVLFAYYANKRYVFKSKTKTKKELTIELYQFFKYRVVSLLIDMTLMFTLVDLFTFNDFISKIIVQVIVIILNYIFSKIFVFKKN